MTLPLQPTYPPMEALAVSKIPTGPQWQYEPKWDGFRCLVFMYSGEVDLRSKAGRPLGRYFPELVEAVATLEAFAQRYIRGNRTLRLSRATRHATVAQGWLRGAGGDMDGVVAKRLDLPYQSGERGGMQKVKRLSTPTVSWGASGTGQPRRTWWGRSAR